MTANVLRSVRLQVFGMWPRTDGACVEFVGHPPRVVVSLLRADVESTIGPGHDEAIIEAAAWRRLDVEVLVRYVGRVVDDVQQHFHDTFVDTTWPSCPFHPNHPLWFSDGWWPRAARWMAQAPSSPGDGVRPVGLRQPDWTTGNVLLAFGVD